MADVLDVDVEDKGGFSEDEGDGKDLYHQPQLIHLTFVSNLSNTLFFTEGIQRLKSAVTKRKGRGFKAGK